jgi:hypothetical protein
LRRFPLGYHYLLFIHKNLEGQGILYLHNPWLASSAFISAMKRTALPVYI